MRDFPRKEAVRHHPRRTAGAERVDRKDRDGLPESFGASEALGVCRLALADALSGLVSCITRFDKVRNSIRYNI